MEGISVAVEMTVVNWEQWIGAAMRRTHFERLLATARPRRRVPRPASRGATRSSLLWMLAVSIAGLWLLRA
jgi:hypothetical protein